MSKKLKVHFAAGGLINRKFPPWKTPLSKENFSPACNSFEHGSGGIFQPELVTCQKCLASMKKRGIRPELYTEIESLPPDVKLAKTLRDNIEKLTPGYKLMVINGVSCLVEEEKAGDTQLSVGETLIVFEVEINVKSKTYGFQPVK